MIRAAFFDFDGTLVPSDRPELAPSTVAALEALRARGVSLWLATGRAAYQVPAIITGGMGGAGAPDGYICSSGSWCFDEGGVFFKDAIDAADVRAIVEEARSGAYDILVMMPDRFFVNRISPRIRRQMDDANLVYPEGDLDEALTGDVLQMCGYVDPGEEDLILAHTHHVVCYRWSPLFCDIVPEGSGKGVGVARTLSHLGLSKDEAIAFGDGGNDVPMLRACGTSVALGNGTPEAKAAATFVAGDVADDGLYRACVELGLIEDELGLLDSGRGPREPREGRSHHG